MSYVYMKVLESAPERYDRGMRLLTLGRLGRAQADMVMRLNPGDRVLDMGCGTGALAVLLARRGCRVTGIDISPAMLRQAARRLQEEGLEDEVTLRELSVVDLDIEFPDCSFDAVVSTLVFSELSDDEIAYTLAQCRRILRPDGKLLVADEVVPRSWLGKIAACLFRFPLAVVTYILTQNTTRRVDRLDQRLAEAGFRVKRVGSYLAGTLELLLAELEKQGNAEHGRAGR